MRTFWSWPFLPSVLFLGLIPAAADGATQPDGTVIPLCNYGGESRACDQSVTSCTAAQVGACVNQWEGQPKLIDVVADAELPVERFLPGCEQTITVIKRHGWSSAFGWYNARSDSSGDPVKPPVSELYPVLSCDLPTGFPLELNIREDPRYAGGEVGFFLATGDCPRWDENGLIEGTYFSTRVYFTESALNRDSEPGRPIFHVLSWQSVNHESTFYMGWEDQSGGGDNDFDDMLFTVEGIDCTSTGEECETGRDGICALGTMQCVRSKPRCVQSIPEGGESCNALDDDCDGEVDEGDLCEGDLVCDNGECVPRCGSGEFRCGSDAVCKAGLCVEPDCAEVECPDGQQCIAGECQDPCAEVTCPFGQICAVGVCVDLCDKLICDQGAVCHDGRCQQCECTGCADGMTCAGSICVDERCEGMNCAADEHCVQGQCINNCDGATCPGGDLCEAGVCEPGTSFSAGGASAGGAGGASGPKLVVDAGVNNQGTGGTRRALDGSGSTGCGCQAPGQQRSLSGMVLMWSALGLALWRAHSRRVRV